MSVEITRALQHHVALDFGGSGTRLARWEGWSLTAVEDLDAATHRWLWGDPAAIVKNLCTLLGTPSTIGISFSGVVDRHTGRILRSDRLR